jgi:hypothetical protein
LGQAQLAPAQFVGGGRCLDLSSAELQFWFLNKRNAE